MAKDLFEEFQNKKDNIRSLIKRATEFGWINETEAAEMFRKMDAETLTIGVIGQMKAGKSTFLNAFVFEEPILSAATTPMTASLSTITYGSEKKILIEFYTKGEWEEQKTTASIPIDKQEMSESQQSKIKAAKELVEKSKIIVSELSTLLGTTREDRFENLIDYVGADGKYVSITKSVTIFYPREYLKGVRIVDTPGFNDPIVSREERTKQFLKEADVVLLMLYAGRPFDATDREILFKDVAQCGMGKVLIGINKYDIPYANGETLDEIRDYVVQEIKKTNNPLGIQILSETEPIPLSAEMALIGTLPMDKVKSTPAYAKAWENAINNFEVTSQQEVLAKSNMNDLSSAVRKVIEREKETILFRKPVSTIRAKGESLYANLLNEQKLTQEKITNLELPDYELEEKEERLGKVKRRLERKIDGLGDGLDEAYDEIIRKGSRDLEDVWSASCKKMSKMVDDWGMFEGSEKLVAKLQEEMQFCSSRTLKREVENIQQTCQNTIKKQLQNFFEDISSVLMRNDMEDCEELLSSIVRKHKVAGVDDDAFIIDFSDDDDNGNWVENALSFVNDCIAVYTLGLNKILGNVLSHGSVAAELKKIISVMASEFDAKALLLKISDSKTQIIEGVRKDVIDGLINPLIEQLADVRNAGANKEKALTEARQKLNMINESIAKIENQLNDGIWSNL